MTCRELDDSLADYTNGDLAPDVRRDLEGHLLRCAACVAYVRSYRRTLRRIRPDDDLLDQLTPEEAPDELTEAILDATVRAAKPARPRRG